jgi:hypothetical protein
MADEVLERIREYNILLEKMPDKTTMLYLRGLNALRSECCSINKRSLVEEVSKKIIESINGDIIKYAEAQRTEVMGILLSAYDSRARLGDLESFMIALEWNRPLEKQFYIPRMKILRKHGLVQDLQDLIDGKLDLLILNLPPRIGKSTLSLFALLLMGALRPDKAILGNGHSTGLTQSFFTELMNIVDNEEYRFKNIFPMCEIVDKSSEYSYFDFGKKKRFHTFMLKSVDGGTTGVAEASNVLYCDDLVKDVETANNPARLEKLWYTYTSTIKDRKIPGCPELHVGTPWSNGDVMNRLVALYGRDGANPRVRVRAVPCYDENGESNFLYDYGVGFPKEYYQEMQLAEDPVIFSAKYLMKCVEREGRPFIESNLQFYTDLPDEEPDRIISYNDVAFGGADYMSQPFGRVYGNEVYINDVVYMKGDPDKTRPIVVNRIIENKVQRAGFEENNGGKLYSDHISNDLKAKDYRCAISSHRVPTSKSKMDRIMACQSEIKGIATQSNSYRVYFLSYDKRKDHKMYNDFMQNLYTWSQNLSAQKTQQDGAPDSTAGLITNILGGRSVGTATSKFSRKDLGI